MKVLEEKEKNKESGHWDGGIVLVIAKMAQGTFLKSLVHQ